MNTDNKKEQNEQCTIPVVRRSVRIQIPLDVAETLHGFIDGGIGTSECDDFTKEMSLVNKRLEKAINKHYA